MAVRRLFPKKLDKASIPTEYETFTNVYFHNAMKYRIWVGPDQPPAEYVQVGDIWREDDANPHNWRMYMPNSTWVSMLAGTQYGGIAQAGLMSATDKQTLDGVGTIGTGLTTHINTGISNNSLAHGATDLPTPNKIASRNSNGELVATGYLSTSSQRFKTAIQDLWDPINTVLRLRGVKFQWKESGDFDYGLIAEEVACVLPEIVDYDEDGNPAGIKYNSLIAYLVEALKAQQEQIDAIKAHIGMI